jgi:hypothetical protein
VLELAQMIRQAYLPRPGRGAVQEREPLGTKDHHFAGGLAVL